MTGALLDGLSDWTTRSVKRSRARQGAQLSRRRMPMVLTSLRDHPRTRMASCTVAARDAHGSRVVAADIGNWIQGRRQREFGTREGLSTPGQALGAARRAAVITPAPSRRAAIRGTSGGL